MAIGVLQVSLPGHEAARQLSGWAVQNITLPPPQSERATRSAKAQPRFCLSRFRFENNQPAVGGRGLNLGVVRFKAKGCREIRIACIDGCPAMHSVETDFAQPPPRPILQRLGGSLSLPVARGDPIRELSEAGKACTKPGVPGSGGALPCVANGKAAIAPFTSSVSAANGSY